jgi:hypothetical protein
LARIEGLLDELVRDIREGRKEPTIVSTYENDDELAWDELERELVGDGITREDVRQYKEENRDYLRRLVEENIEDIEGIGPSDSFSLANERDNSHYSTNNEPIEKSSSDAHEVANTPLPAGLYTPLHQLSLTERQSLVSVVIKSGARTRTSSKSYPRSSIDPIELARARAVVKRASLQPRTFR